MSWLHSVYESKIGADNTRWRVFDVMELDSDRYLMDDKFTEQYVDMQVFSSAIKQSGYTAGMKLPFQTHRSCWCCCISSSSSSVIFGFICLAIQTRRRYPSMTSIVSRSALCVPYSFPPTLFPWHQIWALGIESRFAECARVWVSFW